MDEPVAGLMLRALDLAALGRGRVEPNPMVGAIVVRDGVVVGQGHHAIFGGPHAEVAALNAAGERARGADLYVTLEPCCHRGKTPPCTDRVIAAGIRRVVAATGDPFPRVAGGGFEILRRAGIETHVGLMKREARRLNLAYFKLIETGRPYVHAKWAMTLDGKTATAAGESKWITGEETRAHANQFRGMVDAIVAGIATVIADDPLLTARPSGLRNPMRIVVDSKARTPPDSQLVRTARLSPVMIACTSEADADAKSRLQHSGCECWICPPTPRGRVDLGELLVELGRRRITHLLVEGGSEILGSFVDVGQIDAVRIYMSPSVLGGNRATTPVGGFGIDGLRNRLRLSDWTLERLGDDLFFSGRTEVE